MHTLLVWVNVYCMIASEFIWLSSFSRRHRNCDICPEQKERKLSPIRYQGSVSARGIEALIAYAQNPPLNAQTDVYSSAKGITLDLSLHLHPYFVCASDEASGESA